LGRAYWVRSNTFASINGSQSGNNSYLIDGMYDKALWLNNLVIVPPIDAISEERIMTSNYSAEYGQSAGGVVVVQTKSGTNEYHGEAYEYLRNDKLDANSFFNNLHGVPKTAYHRSQFGGTFGGPLVKNKTFIFGDYYGIRLSQPSTAIDTIPTPAEVNMVETGDFSGLVDSSGNQIPIYDPTNVNSTTGQRAQFQCNGVLNVICPGRIDPVAKKLYSLLPSAGIGASNNYTYTADSTQQTDQFDVRVDQNVGKADRLFVKYDYDNSTVVGPGSIPAPSNSAIPMGL
jgi:hypothetical protein